MSLFDYIQAQEIESKDYPFYALLMSLIRRADTNNLAKLELMWPDIVDEFRQRYNAPGGRLVEETTPYAVTGNICVMPVEGKDG
jgi:hypothetical protein